jgi:hypothetical protein
MVTSAEIVL